MDACAFASRNASASESAVVCGVGDAEGVCAREGCDVKEMQANTKSTARGITFGRGRFAISRFVSEEPSISSQTLIED